MDIQPIDKTISTFDTTSTSNPVTPARPHNLPKDSLKSMEDQRCCRSGCWKTICNFFTSIGQFICSLFCKQPKTPETKPSEKPSVKEKTDSDDVMNNILENGEKMTIISSLKGEAAAKAGIIRSFFSEIEPDFYTFVRSDRQMAELVLEYTGDVPIVERTQILYSRVLLQEDYAVRNKTEPLKSKPVSVISMNSPAQRQIISSLLHQWQQLAIDLHESVGEQYGSGAINRTTFYEKLAFPSACKALIKQAIRGELHSDYICAVVDADKQIQGISYSFPDKGNAHAWYIELVLSAPRTDCVKGVGSALIEAAIQKAMERQGIRSPCSFEAMKQCAVTLQAAFSPEFYVSTFFENIPRSGNRILKGDNLLQFLKHFGGRAQINLES